MELTFFTAAHTVQFGFVAKRMLTTHRCFGCGWTVLAQYQGFICFPYSVPSVSVPRVGEKLGGNMAGTADPNSPKGYSVTCNVVLGNKNWGSGRSVVFDGFGFFGGIFSWLPRQLFGGRLNIRQPVGGGERFPLFCIFCSTDKTVFILTHKFSQLCSFPSCWWGRGVNNWLYGCLTSGWGQLTTEVQRTDGL